LLPVSLNTGPLRAPTECAESQITRITLLSILMKRHTKHEALPGDDRAYTVLYWLKSVRAAYFDQPVARAEEQCIAKSRWDSPSARFLCFRHIAQKELTAAKAVSERAIVVGARA